MRKKILLSMGLCFFLLMAAHAENLSPAQTEQLHESALLSTSLWVIAATAVLCVIIIFGLVSQTSRRRLLKKIGNAKGENLALCVILVPAIILRLILGFSLHGWPNDIASFNFWAMSASSNFTGFYSSGINGNAAYTPAYLYILAPLGLLMRAAGGSSELLLKLPAILADIGLALLLWNAARSRLGVVERLGLTALVAFNPVLLVNSAVWGQVDSILVLILAGALLLLTKGRPVAASALMAVAVLFKPQAIFFLPIFVFELIRRRSLKDLGLTLAAGIVTFFALCLPFSWPAKSDAFSLGGTPLWIFNLYLNAGDSLKYASVNALNFFGLLGKNWVPDTDLWVNTDSLSINYSQAGGVFMIIGFLLAGLMFLISTLRKRPSIKPIDRQRLVGAGLWLMPVIMNAVMFTFGARMHERYMIPAALLILPAYLWTTDRRLLWAFVAMSAANFANILYLITLNWGGYPWIVQFNAFVAFFSALNVVTTLYILWIGFDLLLNGRLKKLRSAS